MPGQLVMFAEPAVPAMRPQPWKLSLLARWTGKAGVIDARTALTEAIRRAAWPIPQPHLHVHVQTFGGRFMSTSTYDSTMAAERLAQLQQTGEIPLPEKEIERTYMVTLVPLDGPTDGAGLPYDPMRVRLRYTLDEAGALDSRSERALAEAVKRAERLERKQHTTAPDTVFAATATLTREALVDYLPRERPRPHRGA